uniref:Uncharacterized protein n=1 Tax=Anguilla anguilla TaxID=7936 RepID=A0A0E9T1U0_ANGAN
MKFVFSIKPSNESCEPHPISLSNDALPFLTAFFLTELMSVSCHLLHTCPGSCCHYC